MNNLPVEMIAEITKWLPKEDLMEARLVWHNIQDDLVDYRAKYIRCMIKRRDTDSIILLSLFDKSDEIRNLYKYFKHQPLDAKMVFEKKILIFDIPLSVNCKSFSTHNRYNQEQFIKKIDKITSQITCYYKYYHWRHNVNSYKLGIYTTYKIYGRTFRPFEINILHNSKEHNEDDHITYSPFWSDTYGFKDN
jgi:hypothetical protein